MVEAQARSCGHIRGKTWLLDKVLNLAAALGWTGFDHSRPSLVQPIIERNSMVGKFSGIVKDVQGPEFQKEQLSLGTIFSEGLGGYYGTI